MITHYLLTISKPQERALIRVLLMAIEMDPGGKLGAEDPRNMTKLVENLAHEFSGRKARSIRQVAGLLSEGMSMVDALEQTPGALDPSAVLALRLASETGTVRETLASLLRQDDSRDRAELDGSTVQRFDFSRGVDGRLFQIGFGFVVTWLIVSFLMLFIIPTFEKMFDEFEIALPTSMLWLIAISRYDALIFWSLILFLVSLFVIQRRLKGKSFWRRGKRRSLSEQTAHLLALFAMIVRQGRPLAAGIGTLAQYHPTPQLRARLSAASTAIARGTEPWQSLQEQKFLTHQEASGLVLAETPASADGSTNGTDQADRWDVPEHARRTQAWLLMHLATRHRDRRQHRNAWLLQTLSLVGLISLTAVVMFTAIAVFSSVYRLVEVLA
ncbi:type II secretion system F family protein [Neorhodopirellula pilleata]|uniref:Type IV pilin biogenesis protein n=1 Tax=Neorhodopirellula pilleata TaxID=2714738 RepID=A0A5C6A684_9BACT|nr:type II secretion system F family protein [Neorhodopirellula pilleata]TWT95029.1 type IV pilin biogenesis protein [Neorhodopirellula pilleata]